MKMRFVATIPPLYTFLQTGDEIAIAFNFKYDVSDTSPR